MTTYTTCECSVVPADIARLSPEAQRRWRDERPRCEKCR